MEKRLNEAAVKGSVETLLNLLSEDEHILDRFIIKCYHETPLHIAAMLGHVDFSKEILARKPELAAELDYRRLSPLHLAAAKGYVELVKALIPVNPDMCLVCDRDGKNPLHLAAINGRVDVLKELARIKPEAARFRVDHGKNILHLCVLHKQLEALKCLVAIMADHEFVNSKDDDGNTILHLAVADKQIKAVKYLLFKASIKVNVNAVNSNGLTALDILAKGRRDMKDVEIGESLCGAQALSAKNTSPLAQNFGPTRTRGLTNVDTSEYPIIPTPARENSWENYLNRQDDWLEKKRSALMVVASLIATMAFQAGVNPPSGTWQDTQVVYPIGYPPEPSNYEPPHFAGQSVMASNHRLLYDSFLVCDTIGLISSLSIILLLISGLPIRHRIFMFVLMVIMWIAITSMALTFVVAVVVLSPDNGDKTVLSAMGSTIIGWAGLMGLLLFAHFI
ncbi:PGG domain, partial [Dillenia turbinata]